MSNEIILNQLHLLFNNSFLKNDSQLRNISSYKSCNVQTKLIKAFDLKISESEIPIEKFKTISDIISFVTLVHNGEFNKSHKDNIVGKHKINLPMEDRFFSGPNTQMNDQLNIIESLSNEKILTLLKLLLGNFFINKGSQLRNISSYKSCNFQTRLIKVFDLKISESEIPIEKFETIGDIISFIILAKNGKFDASQKENVAYKVNSIRVNRFCSEENIQLNERLNIIVTGKSGVGKSSFLNYLIGKDLL